MVHLLLLEYQLLRDRALFCPLLCPHHIEQCLEHGRFSINTCHIYWAFNINFLKGNYNSSCCLKAF